LFFVRLRESSFVLIIFVFHYECLCLLHHFIIAAFDLKKRVKRKKQVHEFLIKLTFEQILFVFKINKQTFNFALKNVREFTKIFFVTVKLQKNIFKQNNFIQVFFCFCDFLVLTEIYNFFEI
jgi:hypothetical protein